jgi:hypothetical protein
MAADAARSLATIGHTADNVLFWGVYFNFIIVFKLSNNMKNNKFLLL